MLLSSRVIWLPESSRVSSCGSRVMADGNRLSWLYLKRNTLICCSSLMSSGRSVRLLLLQDPTVHRDNDRASMQRKVNCTAAASKLLP